MKTEVRSKNVILYGVREDQDIDDIESRTEKPSMIFSAPLGRSPISVSAPISFWGRKIAVKNPLHQNVCLSTSDAAVLSASAEKCRTSCSQVQLLDLLNLYDKTNFFISNCLKFSPEIILNKSDVILSPTPPSPVILRHLFQTPSS